MFFATENEVLGMKKFIFGCVLMICGMIGSSAWLIAKVLLVEPGAWSTVLNIFDFGRVDCYIILFFYLVTIFGALIAVKELKK